MRNYSIFLSLLAFSLFLFACQQEPQVKDDLKVSNETLSQIASAGYNHTGVTAEFNENGVVVYRVEGCYEFTGEDLANLGSQSQALLISEEQYRTNLLVTGLPRVIKVALNNRLPSSYAAALDLALSRYNAENLQLTFQRVTTGANITFVPSPKNAGYLASAGFPTSNGNPYSQIKINVNAIAGQPQATIASIMAHEIGHCIGFRHTDYMDRSYSCGGSYYNEGASSVGAVLIPGTPTGPDANSWMLSCIGSGDDRPFNNNDKTALNYLY
ncbi:MAG: M57 family metalloprotease [Bacteroidales bacterium]